MNIDAFKKITTSIGLVPEQELVRLVTAASRQQVRKGDFLLQEGQVCQHIYFLEKGFMRMYYLDPDGNEINYRFAEAPNFFVDYQSFLTQKPSRYYWQAMQDVEVMAFSTELVQQSYQHSPLWNNFGRLMAERAYLMMNERVEMLQFLTPEQRYQYILKTYPDLPTKISQAHLASYLGIKPESLSRIRHRQEKRIRS